MELQKARPKNPTDETTPSFAPITLFFGSLVYANRSHPHGKQTASAFAGRAQGLARASLAEQETWSTGRGVRVWGCVRQEEARQLASAPGQRGRLSAALQQLRNAEGEAAVAEHESRRTAAKLHDLQAQAVANAQVPAAISPSGTHR